MAAASRSWWRSAALRRPRTGSRSSLRFLRRRHEDCPDHLQTRRAPAQLHHQLGHDPHAYERKIAERFGGQQELDLVVPTPSTAPPEMKGAAN